MLLLAQVPAGLSEWLGCLAFVLVLLDKGSAWLDRMRGKKQEFGPQPFEVKAAQEFVSRASYHVHCDINRAEHDKMNGRVDGVLLKLDQVKTELLKAGADREESLGHRISHLDGIVGEGRGEQRQLTNQLGEIARVAHQAATQAAAAAASAAASSRRNS
jgi:hypothetical protein